ncbi:Imm52 family immunity protein [Providencia zhijiangensis]|uniref:Imm52 family immunity protein n=1 Tax=Providencia zhijiangensis TaxID=3053982 RepID=A0ABZ0N0J5_9GAMM|nr:Imm52 family immunity protein [Providencia sp. D4759]WPA91897.1 Imm52 family immunity protein [Providencia sp. D4759]
MNLNIELDISLNDKMVKSTVIDIFQFMIEFSKKMASAEPDIWYFCGDSQEEALEYKAFENGKPTSFFTDEYEISNIEGIWAGDDNALVMVSNGSGSVYRLNFDLRRVVSFSFDMLLDLISESAIKFNLIDIRVNTNGYSYHQRNVFPDKLPVGWMLYLNKKITQQQVPMAAQLIHIDNDKNHGTLIISTDHVFDGENKEDIKKANEIEIQLAGLGLLPLIREIYS